MVRQIRIEYSDAVYHVMSHGNGFQWIYKSDKQVALFKNILIDTIIKYNLKMHAVVLMRNHYHILVETPDANLSSAMKKFNRDFAMMFNAQTGRKGTVFKDRYKSIIIDKESYYLNVLRYISQNPIRLKLVEKCEDYEGGFLKWLIKDREFSKYLYLEDIKGYFSDSKDWFKSYVNWLNIEKEENPNKNSKYKYILGSEEWKEKILNKFSDKKLERFKEKKKLNMNFDLKKLNQELKKINPQLSLKLRIYFYNKYLAEPYPDLISESEVKSRNGYYQRIYRIKKELKKDFELRKLIEYLEKKIIKC